jgi:bifunctional DNA-binding transcriptional regulator/antitoxin component of YhaV-PrlF toxin-antitoxin module
MTTVVKEKNQLVVPESIQRRARLKTGDAVEFRATPGVITIITKPPVAADEYTPEQRRIIDARLAKADEDIKAGRVYGPFNTAEEMAASVEANIKKLRGAKRKIKPAR